MASLRCGQLSGFAAAVLFGCSAPLISTFTASGSSLSIAGLLYAGTTLALAIVRLMKGRTQDESPLQRRDAPALAGLILLGGIVGPVALVHGLARLPAASSSLLLNLETVFTLAIAVLVGREHLGKRGAAAAALTIAGAIVLSDGSLGGVNATGAALIALATLAWGIDNNLSQRLSLRDPIQIATVKALGASLPMLVLAWVLGHPFPPAAVCGPWIYRWRRLALCWVHGDPGFAPATISRPRSAASSPRFSSASTNYRAWKPNSTRC